jgi:hypothetical protein
LNSFGNDSVGIIGKSFLIGVSYQHKIGQFKLIWDILDAIGNAGFVDNSYGYFFPMAKE